MSDGNSISAQWVVARYEGEKAKYIHGMIREGAGYFELSSGPNWILVAFRHVGELPPHLTPVTEPKQLEALEKRQQQRLGVEPKRRRPDSPAQSVDQVIRKDLE